MVSRMNLFELLILPINDDWPFLDGLANRSGLKASALRLTLGGHLPGEHAFQPLHECADATAFV
jgi:hypothetical protein